MGTSKSSETETESAASTSELKIINLDCCKVARGTQIEHFFMIVYLSR